ncbi:MAG: DUF2635 domain-containing protein [Rhodospirillaceae bacterium]|nr:MAG: DUF2635 domain-containing protein [Rhodospirillaceae bacterium]
MFLKPASPDLKVRDPERGKHLPPEGAEVPNTEYWRRSLRRGDVALVVATQATALRGKAKE